jgi:hypothetical protein
MSMNFWSCRFGRESGLTRAGHGLPQGPELFAEDLEVQRGLAGKVVVEHRLVDAGAPDDAIDFGPIKSARGKLVQRGVHEFLPSRAGGGAGHLESY